MDCNENEFQYFKEAIVFFNEVKWLFNVPVTRIMVEGSLDSIPIEWVEALRNLKNSELNNFVSKAEVQSNWPASLINFVAKCKILNKLPDSNVALSPIQLPGEFLNKLSVKKQHEIFHLAQLVHEQCSLQNISTIVDFGAGLGYICQLLNYLYNYKVLGLESKAQNVETARIRQKTLFPDSLSSVKYICSEITEDSARSVELILQDSFQDTESVGLIALHACGDLSVHISRMYLEMNRARILILMSCCYHKLTLKDNRERTGSNARGEYFNNFPLSVALKNAADNSNTDIGETFNRPFMRLASQETSIRWLTMLERTHKEHSFCVLARAVLDFYAAQNGLILKKLVRKATRKSQCTGFDSYLSDCTQRYAYEKEIVDGESASRAVPWSDEVKREITKLWRDNAEKQETVELYTGLQLLLQQAVETLILMDRLCFLKERKHDTNILPVMNKSLSPRCYAIVSRKNKICRKSAINN